MLFICYDTLYMEKVNFWINFHTKCSHELVNKVDSYLLSIIHKEIKTDKCIDLENPSLTNLFEYCEDNKKENVLYALSYFAIREDAQDDFRELAKNLLTTESYF